ncbi:MAG: hypothetical protein KJ593_01075 [Candidatus Omnitrophica bacterium]|nr:hypothetical protein [Candidatus Omnitrophota bacterium]
MPRGKANRPKLLLDKKMHEKPTSVLLVGRDEKSADNLSGQKVIWRLGCRSEDQQQNRFRQE